MTERSGENGVRAGACLLVSVFCPDRKGLIAAITGRLFDLGANLGDTTFAVLGEGAKFTSVCGFPHTIDPEEVRQSLAQLPELGEAELQVTRFGLADDRHPASASVTHRITLQGGDHPGLIARLSETFIDFDGNIVRLNAETLRGGAEDLYAIELEVCLPPARADACLAAVSNTASNLQMSCGWTRV